MKIIWVTQRTVTIEYTDITDYKRTRTETRENWQRHINKIVNSEAFPNIKPSTQITLNVALKAVNAPRMTESQWLKNSN